jgi:hypothetical protein
MPKLKSLILDAGVVIRLHELDIWQQVVEKCELHLSRIVAEREVLFQPGDEQAYGDPIDLQPFISTSKIEIFDVTINETVDFRNRFDPTYADDLDDGESESLVYMLHSEAGFLISSGDAIVYRVLGNIGWGDRGISLEEILETLGLRRTLDWPYTKSLREKYTQEGRVDSIQRRGQTMIQ